MRAIRFTVLLCLITFNYFLFAQENTRPTVAILEFEGQGISLQEVQTLTERMRTEIGNTNAIHIVYKNFSDSSNVLNFGVTPHPDAVVNHST